MSKFGAPESSEYYVSLGEEFEVHYLGEKTFKVPSKPGEEFVVDVESGYGSEIKLNGEKLPSVEHVRIYQPPKGPLRVAVTFLAAHVTEGRE